MKINSYKSGVPSYLFPSNYIIVFVQSDMFVTEYRSLIIEINSIHDIYVDDFLSLRTAFKYLFQRTIVCMQFFLSLGCLKQMSNGCYERFISNLEISLTEGAWPYDKWVVLFQTLRLKWMVRFSIDSILYENPIQIFTGVKTWDSHTKHLVIFFWVWFLVFSQKECFSHNRILGINVFSTTCLKVWRVSSMRNPFPFYQSSKCSIFCESNHLFSQFP